MSRPVHFEILGDDPEKLIAFYKDTFGWEVATWDGPQTHWTVKTGPEGSPGINGGIMGRHLPQAVINTIQVESMDETLGSPGGQALIQRTLTLLEEQRRADEETDDSGS